MSTAVAVDANAFWRDGYQIVKRVFSVEQVATLRRQAYDALESDRKVDRVMSTYGVSAGYGDLLSKEGLRSVVLDERIRSIATELLDADPIYFGCSAYHIGGAPAPAAWHKDNRGSDRLKDGLDWRTPRYPIIRMGIYLQDHARHSNGLGVRVGSHRAPGVRHGKPYLVPTEPGDVVVWPLTTTHAGHTTRLRFAGSRAMKGRWLRLVPSPLKRPQQCERIALFMSFGRASEDLDRWIDYIKTERDDELEWYRRSHFGQDVWQLVKERGLTVRKIIPEYGAPDPKLSPNKPAAAASATAAYATAKIVAVE